MKKLSWGLVIAALAFMLSGCASVEHKTPGDPLESMNRAVFKFNDALDRAVLKPVATGYKAVTPEFFRHSVKNFFGNAGDVWGTVNAALQFKGEKFLQGFFRVGVNTIFGFGGLFDVASSLGLPSPEEDFGQTLGYWGVGSGPYIVWPLLGPSNMRDSVGLAADIYANPLTFIKNDKVKYGLTTLGIINLRARLLGVEEAAEGSMFDRYIFYRDAYMQRRQNLIYDGAPPMDDSFDISDDDL